MEQMRNSEFRKGKRPAKVTAISQTRLSAPTPPHLPDEVQLHPQALNCPHFLQLPNVSFTKGISTSCSKHSFMDILITRTDTLTQTHPWQTLSNEDLQAGKENRIKLYFHVSLNLL